MSLENLLSGDTADFARPVTTKDASGGKVITYPTNYATAQDVRVEDMSASDMAVYMQQDIVVTNRVFGQLDDVALGDRIATSDDRYIIVKTVKKRREIGNMPTYFVYVGEEVRPGS